jgi:4-amino-4-deoxy-L-arabinose transferase-like glycosyltransferase
VSRTDPGRVLLLASVVGVGLYAWLLLGHLAHGVGGSDNAGYANTARDILSGRVEIPIPIVHELGLPDRFARAFMPLAAGPGVRPATMVPYYPPGFPLHVALAALLLGWENGPFLVSPLCAVLWLVLVYQLGRELSLSRPLAFAGAAVLGVCPVVLFQAVLPMSDVAAAAWCAAALLFSIRARRDPGWAWAAGVAFGISVLVRPSDALLLVPIAFALPWRRLALQRFAVAGVPSAVFFGLWNLAAYGGALRTGYGQSGQLSHDIALANIPTRASHYAYWLAVQLSPLIPAGWLAWVGLPGSSRRNRAMLAAWFLSFFLFYSSWGPNEEWWYTRYLIPALPALVLGSLLALQALMDRLEGRGLVAAAASLLAVAAFEGWQYDQIRPLRIGRSQIVFPEASRAVAALAPGGKALVVSMEFSGSLRFYTDLTPIRWDWLAPGDFVLVRAKAAERGYRVLAVLLPSELDEARPHVPGPWKFVGNVRKASIWELAPP